MSLLGSTSADSWICCQGVSPKLLSWPQAAAPIEGKPTLACSHSSRLSPVSGNCGGMESSSTMDACLWWFIPGGPFESGGLLGRLEAGCPLRGAPGVVVIYRCLLKQMCIDAEWVEVFRSGACRVTCTDSGATLSLWRLRLFVMLFLFLLADSRRVQQPNRWRLQYLTLRRQGTPDLTPGCLAVVHLAWLRTHCFNRLLAVVGTMR